MAMMLNLPEYPAQLGAVTGISAAPDYEKYIESYASRLPELAAEDYNRRMAEEQIAMNKKAQEQAARDSTIGLGITAVNTGIEAAPFLQKFGAKTLAALKPKPVMGTSIPASTTVDMYAPTSTNMYAPVTSAAPVDMGSMYAQPFQSAAPATQPTLGAAIPPTTNVAEKSFLAPVTEFKGGLQRLGESAGLESKAAGGLAAVGSAAANYGIERSNMGEFMHKKVGGGEQQWDDAATSMSSFLLGGPVGLGLNLAGIGIREFGKKNCIIVTACCGADSEEVNITREYRDKFMTGEHKKGYYYIADSIVPIMESSPEFKAVVKEKLVDSLIRYGKWKLGYTREHPSELDCAVTKNFLNYCRDIGSTIHGPYVRPNGEEVS